MCIMHCRKQKGRHKKVAFIEKTISLTCILSQKSDVVQGRLILNGEQPYNVIIEIICSSILRREFAQISGKDEQQRQTINLEDTMTDSVAFNFAI